VSAYLRVVRRILAQVPGAGVILAHHAGWQDGETKKKRERGSSAFRGNSDVTLYLELAGEDPKRGEAYLLLRTYKARDVEKPAPLSCIRRRVSLNESDSRGEPVTSCIIEPDLRTREEREADADSAEDAENRIVDLRVLRKITEHPQLATSLEQIRILAALKRNIVCESVARLIDRHWLLLPEHKRLPYVVTDDGQAALKEEN
jgi:hypothetical protein